jgi:hypothetical protein
MTTIEKAAKLRFSQGLDATIEDSLNYVSTFPEDQLNKIAEMWNEEQAIKDFANEIFDRYSNSGKTVMEVVKENVSDIKASFNIHQFFKYGVDENNYDRNEQL